MASTNKLDNIRIIIEASRKKKVLQRNQDNLDAEIKSLEAKLQSLPKLEVSKASMAFFKYVAGQHQAAHDNNFDTMFSKEKSHADNRDDDDYMVIGKALMVKHRLSKRPSISLLKKDRQVAPTCDDNVLCTIEWFDFVKEHPITTKFTKANAEDSLLMESIQQTPEESTVPASGINVPKTSNSEIAHGKDDVHGSNQEESPFFDTSEKFYRTLERVARVLAA